MRSWLLVAVMAVVMVGLGGCSTPPGRGEAQAAARRFVQHLSRHDGRGACDLLTDQARQAAPGATDASCAEAVGTLEAGGSDVTSVSVWGDAAQVRIGDDVIFLRRVAGSWRVSAAGCTPQPAGPYECKVGG